MTLDEKTKSYIALTYYKTFQMYNKFSNESFIKVFAKVCNELNLPDIDIRSYYEFMETLSATNKKVLSEETLS